MNWAAACSLKTWVTALPGVFDEERAAKLRARLPHFTEGVVEWHNSLDSTQTRAQTLARQGIRLALIVADEQTAGRGRLSRRWESQKGSGLYLSLLFQPKLPPEKTHFANIAAALAVERAVVLLSDLEPALKWPNDVLLDERKVCGILSESAYRDGAVDYCVTGIGINLRRPSQLPPDVETRAAWLLDVAPLDVNALLSTVAEGYLGLLETMGREGVGGVLERYRAKCASIGREITVETGEESLTGRCSGIGEGGELILETLKGKRAFNVADVTHASLS